MHNTLQKRFLNSCSDNLKAKTCGERRRTIENPKWVGIFAIALTFAFGGAAVEAQQPTKIPRIGYLGGGSPSSYPARIEAFRQGLRELGYVEGKNIVVEYRYAEGKPDRERELAAELARLKVDVIVTGGSHINPCRQGSNCHDSHCHGVRMAILLVTASSPALRGLAGTLLDCQPLPRS